MKCVSYFHNLKVAILSSIWWAHKSLIKVFIQFIKFGKFNSKSSYVHGHPFIMLVCRTRTLAFLLDNKADFSVEQQFPIWIWSHLNASTHIEPTHMWTFMHIYAPALKLTWICNCKLVFSVFYWQWAQNSVCSENIRWCWFDKTERIKCEFAAK